jgi:hypothetical protein
LGRSETNLLFTSKPFRKQHRDGSQTAAREELICNLLNLKELTVLVTMATAAETPMYAFIIHVDGEM